jgi:ribosome-associated protein
MADTNPLDVSQFGQGRLLTVHPRVRIPLEEFQFTFARSGGPGGQNVNKVNSKAILRWGVLASPSLPPEVRQRFLEQFGRRVTREGELVIASQRFRDQARNIDDCLEKLRGMLLAVAVAPRTRRATKPTRGSREERLKSKRVQSKRKTDRRQQAWD